MKHYKVNTMDGHRGVEIDDECAGFGPPGVDHLEVMINTNQYVCWTFINDKRHNSLLRIKKGDILHILKSKSSNNPVYYKGEVLSHLIIDNEYRFSKNILQWEWDIMKERHHGKKEMKYIIYWVKQPYPNEELYHKINQGYNAQTVKEIKL